MAIPRLSTLMAAKAVETYEKGSDRYELTYVASDRLLSDCERLEKQGWML